MDTQTQKCILWWCYIIKSRNYGCILFSTKSPIHLRVHMPWNSTAPMHAEYAVQYHKCYTNICNDICGEVNQVQWLFWLMNSVDNQQRLIRIQTWTSLVYKLSGRPEPEDAFTNEILMEDAMCLRPGFLVWNKKDRTLQSVEGYFTSTWMEGELCMSSAIK